MPSSLFPHFLKSIFSSIAIILLMGWLSATVTEVGKEMTDDEKKKMFDPITLHAVKSVPLPQILSVFGITPVRPKVIYPGTRCYSYLASYRNEQHPSLSVFLTPAGEWHWRDHATDEHGTSLDLLVKFGLFPNWRHTAGYIAKHYLGIDIEHGVTPIPAQRLSASVTRRNNNHADHSGKIRNLYSIESSPAVGYITGERCIPIEVAVPYLRYAKYSYDDNEKAYSGIAWPTLKGGWAIRWAKDLGPHKGKTFVGPAGISFLPVGHNEISESCIVFEGMFDFLSFLALHNCKAPCDTIVLNSTSHVNQAVEKLGGYRQIDCYMDNDDAGRHATNEIRKAFGDAIVAVVDHSWEYAAYNDLNDYLIQHNNTIIV